MATPYDLYLRFLVTKGFDDLKEVNAHLETLNLSPVKQDAFDKQYEMVTNSLPKPLIKQIELKFYEPEFLKWMGVLEVKELWLGEKAFLIPEIKRQIHFVQGLHGDPYLRLCINALLVKALQSAELAEVINVRFSAMLKDSHVDLYQKYFFDPRRLTRKDWKSFLKDQGNQEKHIYFTALTEDIDTLKTELELPAQVNVSEPIQFLLTKSYQKAKDYLRLSTKEANVEARAWITQVISLAEKYEKFKTGDKTDFSKQLQMEFDFVDTEFATPDADTLAELMAEHKLVTDKPT